MIWSIIVGLIIGAVAAAITKKENSMGWVSKIIAGLVGSWIGQGLFHSWGPSLAGMAIIPSILGAIIVIAVISFFTDRSH